MEANEEAKKVIKALEIDYKNAKENARRNRAEKNYQAVARYEGVAEGLYRALSCMERLV